MKDLSFTLILSVSMIGACVRTQKAPSSQTSNVQAAEDKDCACDDLQCWEKATDRGVSSGLQCMKDAGFGAASAIGGNLLAISVGAYQISEALYDEDFVSLLKTAAGQTSNISKWEGNAAFECLKTSSTSVSKFLSFLTGTAALSQSVDTQIAFNFIKTSYDAIGSSLRFGESAAKCFQGVSNLDKSFVKVSKGLAKVGIAFSAFTAIKSCGYAATDGGQILFENTACYVDDIQKLLEQKEKLADAHEKNANGAPPNGSGPDHCNEEPLSCSPYAMGKWGSHLFNQADGILETRSYFCANMCGNNGSRNDQCSITAADIFSSAPSCGQAACSESQCEQAIDRCISYCCQQDGTCVEDAQKKLLDYDL